MPVTSFQHKYSDGTDRFYNPVPIAPGETLQDPVGKLRVSNPQALIDTDFEYSTQSTKWESLNLLNNRPSAFYDVTTPLTITDVTGAGTRVVTVATASPPAVSTPIFIQNTTNAGLYPDGPDVLTVKVTNVSAQATNSIQARISWTEA